MSSSPRAQAADRLDVFQKDNLVAWCIVPFDAKRRGPEERAEMLQRLGFSRFAYDYRAEHIPTFDKEMESLKSRRVGLDAWWFPTVLNEEAKNILTVLKRHNIKSQLWVTGGGGPAKDKAEQQKRVDAEADRIRPIVEAADAIGCSVALYNHGGWFGEPENQIAIIQKLGKKNVGIVYNLHHGHDHLDRFPDLLAKMKPYLLTLNLNGMTKDGDKKGQKILPIGAGDLDLDILRAIVASGYRGPIGILNHTDQDAEARLQDNLDGLRWLVEQLEGKPARPRPKYRTYPEAPASRKQANAEPAAGNLALDGGMLVDGRGAFRDRPLSIELRARLTRKESFNILVASERKAVDTHWELFTMAGSGHFCVYFPGMTPDHVRSTVDICNGEPHDLLATLETQRARLFVDGKLVAEQAIQPARTPAPSTPVGEFAIGRLVEGELACHGEIELVRVSVGVRNYQPLNGKLEVDRSTLGYWSFPKPAAKPAAAPIGKGTPYDEALVAKLLQESQTGDAKKGILVFTAPKFACISCHKIGAFGGPVGPELTTVGKCLTPQQIVESVVWPKRDVKKEFQAWKLVLTDGAIVQGYKVKESATDVTLRIATTGIEQKFARGDIELAEPTGSLMPEGLAESMTDSERRDLLRFLLGLGKEIAGDKLSLVHSHAPAKFTYDKAPLDRAAWTNAKAFINRDRLYDFYAKEAAHFVRQKEPAPLLPEFPGLDGGGFGHWGNQHEATWADNRWNDSQLGVVQAGIFKGAGVTVPRGVCVRIGDGLNASCCFNPENLSYDAVWTDGFLKFSSVRHGFVDGVLLDGKPVPVPAAARSRKPTDGPFRYLGFYQAGSKILFAYNIAGVTYLDSPSFVNGQFQRTVAPADRHPLRHLSKGGPRLWPDDFFTTGSLGAQQPFAVDTIPLPFANPWKSLLFIGDHDFFPDGRAAVCTMQGDVWLVDGLDDTLARVRWRRFASGLSHALGLVIANGKIYVQGRDQITCLHDLNGDDQADFYECFSNAFEMSPAGHDFICGLHRDTDGAFYTVTGNQGLIRIAPDGKSARLLASGFRNPDGLGLLPDGSLTVPCSEGEWTPTSMICLVKQPRELGAMRVPEFFGYKGPRNNTPPSLPLVYLPRGWDNSAGGQVHISSDKFGPWKDQLIHLSYGAATSFVILKDEVNGQPQGTVIPMKTDFAAGAHRGRFHPKDGQLYVSGMAGWGTYGKDDGCFHRVRFTGGNSRYPVACQAHENGMLLTFSEPIDPETAGVASKQFAQAWNYRYSSAYGSNEYSPSHFGIRGHDRLEIVGAHVGQNRRSLFLEIPALQPTNQVHLYLAVDHGAPIEMLATIHRLRAPFTGFDGYKPMAKSIAAHPLLVDLANKTEVVRNPFGHTIVGARKVVLEAGKNLTYATRALQAKPGEAIQLTFKNPDVVPHNWVLVKPGALERVGDQVNKLVTDPAAVARGYVPNSPDVLAYTDIVQPESSFVIYFRVPMQKGRYPFLCTFPGHWMVMNGQLVVE